MEELSNYYQIYIQGHLGQNWSDWLQSFHIQYKENGITILTGPVVDQAALRGLLDRLFDLGISILSFRRLGFYPEGKVIFPL
ncbi:MAG: hypothetical protein C4545_02510 [Anaerolineaceae bacterium]|jgi:hypothetical protein|nr:MAG: hypothetical protein C4545_02510 [Anaerolineaceae bacterium]